jgi:hypothetical protein
MTISLYRSQHIDNDIILPDTRHLKTLLVSYPKSAIKKRTALRPRFRVTYIIPGHIQAIEFG